MRNINFISASAVFFLVAIQFCCCEKANGQQNRSGLELDPALIVESKVVWDVIAQDENPLWPGWNAQDTPVLIYMPGKQEMLINHPAPPKDFKRFASPVTEGIDNVWIRSGETEIDWDGQNTSREIFGYETLVLADTLSNRKNWLRGWVADPRDTQTKMDDILYENMRADVYEQLAMIVHEAFHVFQMRELNHKTADERDVRVYPCLSVENNVGVALESIALANAIRAQSKEDTRKHACQWLAIRNSRRSNLPEKARQYEDQNEFIEGTAKYIEVVFMEQIEGSKPIAPLWYLQGFQGFKDLGWFKEYRLKQMLDNMQGKVNVNNDPYGTSPVRGRLYFSGMGIALLLDKISPTWKSDIANPEMSLTKLVENEIRPTESELKQGLARATGEATYDELVQEKKLLAENGRKDIQGMLNGIRQGENTMVHIDWSALNSDRVGLSFTPFGVRGLSESQTIYTLVPISAELSSSQYFFKQGTPANTFEDRKEKVFEFQLRGTVNDEWLTKQLGNKFENGKIIDGLEIDAFGTLIKAARAQLNIDSNKFTVKMLPVAE